MKRTVLRANPKRFREASRYHDDVFAFWGPYCYLCPMRTPVAQDAAHVIPRSKLGPLRYANVHFARPAHRICHERQERNEIDWSLRIKQDATIEYNNLSKIGMKVPE